MGSNWFRKKLERQARWKEKRRQERAIGPTFSSVEKRFWREAKGFTLSELRRLLAVRKSCPPIYTYKVTERATERPTPGSTAWPLEFLRTHFHHKHLFRDLCPRGPAVVGRAVSTWANKLRWRFALQDAETSSISHLKTRPPRTRPFDGMRDERLERFTDAVANTVCTETLAAQRRFSRQVTF